MPIMPDSPDDDNTNSPPDFIDQILADKASQEARQKAVDPPRKTRTAANGTARQKWLDARLHGVCDDVRSTPVGKRNARLRWGARQLAEVAHHGLDESRCKRELERAAEDNGLWKEDGAHQCRASIENGWTAGVNDPKDIDHVGTMTSSTGIRAETNGKVETNGHAKTNGEVPDIRTVDHESYASIKSTVPQWVWTWNDIGRIQHGTLSMFAGKPAAGKSTATRWFASRLSRGELEGCWFGHPMKVGLIMSEEQPDAVIKPGLAAAGANLPNVLRPRVRDGALETGFTTSDVSLLTEWAVNNEVRALFVDPILSTLGAKVDMYRANEVRPALEPFVTMAKEINGIVVGVVHLKKGDVKDVLGGINGSSAFGEVPRAVFGFAPVDKDSGDHVLEQCKNSAGQSGLKLGYTLPIEHGTSDDGQPTKMVRFNITGETETSISDLDSTDDQATTGIATACEWLKMYLLENQPAPSSQVKIDAKKYGDMNDSMIRRAAKRLKVVITTRSMPDKPYTTVWGLPFGESPSDELDSETRQYLHHIRTMGGSGPVTSFTVDELTAIVARCLPNVRNLTWPNDGHSSFTPDHLAEATGDDIRTTQHHMSILANLGYISAWYDDDGTTRWRLKG
jgi:hypothetical protein